MLNAPNKFNFHPGNTRHSLRYPRDAFVHDLHFSSNGKQLAVAFDAGLVGLWDVQTLQIVHKFENPAVVWSIRFSLTGDNLFAGCKDSRIRVWDTAKGHLVSTLEGRDKDALGVRCMAASSDGKWLATGMRVPSLWELATKKETTLDLENARAANRLYLISFSPDSESFVTVNHGVGCRFWETKSGKQFGEIRRVSAFSLAYGPDGKTIAIGGLGTVSLWDPIKRTEICKVKMCEEAVAGVAYSADGKYLVAGGRNGTGDAGQVSIWDLATGKEIDSFWPHRNGFLNLAISPDGKWLATSGLDQAIHLYDFAEIVKKR